MSHTSIKRFRGLSAVAWRESRTARRRLLLYMSSIVLGVAALVAIDSFAQNATASVHDQARALLGGDLALTARDSFPAPVMQLLDSLTSEGVGVAEQTTTASMAVAPDTNAFRLVQLRAVTPGYPFYGAIETDPINAWQTLQSGANAVVDSALLVTLRMNIGDSLSLGAERFRVAGTIRSVSGEVAATATVGPRVYIAANNLAATHLLVFGSVAEKQALLRLPASMTAGQFRQRLAPILGPNRVRMRTVAQNEANLSEAIDQLRNFLSVVSLVALLLGGIGVASGVNAFVMRKIDTVAVLRCLGATSGQILVIYVLQAAAMGLVGAAVGTVLGIAAQFAIPSALAGLLPQGIEVTLAPRAALLGLGVGLWVALVFALRPLLTLRRISPLQALRRETDAAVLGRRRTDGAAMLVSLATVASVFALTLSRADDWHQGAGFGVAIFLAVGVLWAVASALIAVAKRLVRPAWPFVLRQAVASLHRPSNQTRAVVLSLGFGVFLMSTLYQAQTNLLRQLDRRLVQLNANVAFFDVQRAQAAGVDSVIRTARASVVQRVPIVMMRIQSIGSKRPDFLQLNEPPSSDSTAVLPGRRNIRVAREAGRAGRAFMREWRATYSDTIASGETVVAGRWFPAKGGAGEVSIDSAAAKRLRLSIGDSITWMVQGVAVRSKVTSFRSIDPTQLQPSFPLVFAPGLLEDAPQQFVFLVQARGPGAVAQLQREIMREYPSVSTIDLTLVEQTISSVLGKVMTAIRFLALISLMLAVPVLFSAVSATRRERLREGVLLKTLGATKRQIGRMMLAEYLLLGALGSMAGVILSFGSAWALLHFLFHLPFVPAVLPALIVSVGMTAVAIAIGLLTSRDVFASTPMVALRES